mgnify:CR=1 FL=1
MSNLREAAMTSKAWPFEEARRDTVLRMPRQPRVVHPGDGRLPLQPLGHHLGVLAVLPRPQRGGVLRVLGAQLLQQTVRIVALQPALDQRRQRVGGRIGHERVLALPCGAAADLTKLAARDHTRTGS